MRIAEVIGTVTLSRVHPTLAGYRWIVGVPCSLAALQANGKGDGEDLVMFDNLGVRSGDRIGFSEGGEAAAPFLPERKAVDAYCACLLDRIAVS
jgi:ethanolamine utilization protein EutN